MRLTPEQVEAIKATAAEVFGPDAEVWLFGSRADDSRRGGDIDLYVELGRISSEERTRLEAMFWAKLQRLLGERKIDVVTHPHGAPVRPIDRQARSSGVRL